MATSAEICILTKDGKLKGVRCNYDGYVYHTGKILLENYNTKTLVTKLLSLGDMSTLQAKMNKPVGHSFSKPVDGYTIFYGRDRDEDNVSAKKYDSVQDVFSNCNVDYVYVFDTNNNSWYFCKPKGELESLTRDDVKDDVMAKGGEVMSNEMYAKLDKISDWKIIKKQQHPLRNNVYLTLSQSGNYYRIAPFFEGKILNRSATYFTNKEEAEKDYNQTIKEYFAQGGEVGFSPVAAEKANIEELFSMADEIGLTNYHNLNKEVLRKKILEHFKLNRFRGKMAKGGEIKTNKELSDMYSQMAINIEEEMSSDKGGETSGMNYEKLAKLQKEKDKYTALSIKYDTNNYGVRQYVGSLTKSEFEYAIRMSLEEVTSGQIKKVTKSGNKFDVWFSSYVTLKEINETVSVFNETMNTNYEVFEGSYSKTSLGNKVTIQKPKNINMAKGGKVVENGDVKLPAGKYYVGDLCYVLHDEWDEVCDLTIKENECINGVFTLKNGTQFALYGTAYGDGGYYDTGGREYGVDSGTLGCVLVSKIDTKNKDNDLSDGNIIGFETSFTTGYMGKDEEEIYFGMVVINTGYEDEDDDDDDDFNEDDYDENDEDRSYARGGRLQGQDWLDEIIKTPWGEGRIYEISGSGSNENAKVDVNGKTYIMNMGEIDEQDIVKYAMGGEVGTETTLAFYGDKLKYIDYKNKTFKPIYFYEKLSRAKQYMEDEQKSLNKNYEHIILPYKNNRGTAYVIYRAVDKFATGGGVEGKYRIILGEEISEYDNLDDLIDDFEDKYTMSEKKKAEIVYGNDLIKSKGQVSIKYATGGGVGYELENYIISGKNFKNKYATDFNGQVAKVIYTKNLDLGSNLGKGSYWNVTQDSLDIYSGKRDEELDSKYGQYFKNTIYKKIDDNLKIFVKDEIADELWDNEKLYNKIKNISDGIYDPSYDDYGLLLFENQYADGGGVEGKYRIILGEEISEYDNLDDLIDDFEDKYTMSEKKKAEIVYGNDLIKSKGQVSIKYATGGYAMLGGSNPLTDAAMKTNIVEPALGPNFETVLMMKNREFNPRYEQLDAKFPREMTDKWKVLYRSDSYQGYAKISPDGKVIKASVLGPGSITGVFYVKSKAVVSQKGTKTIKEKVKSFNDVKPGDIAVDYAGQQWEVIKTGKVKDLLKYDDSGAAEDGLNPDDNAVAVYEQGANAVFDYSQEGAVVYEDETKTIPGLDASKQLSILEVDALYRRVPKLDDPYYPKSLIKQVGDIAYYMVMVNEGKFLLAMDTTGNYDDKWYFTSVESTNNMSTPKERGGADIRIELTNGNVTVLHGSSGEVLLNLQNVPTGTWDKLWDFLRNKLV